MSDLGEMKNGVYAESALLGAGEWAQTVQHPANNLTKEYIVTLQQPPSARQLEELAAGCVVDGAFVQPKSLAFAAANRRDKLRVVVGEGRNREVLPAPGL